MFVIEVPYFSLDQIYESGQCPRWIRLKESKYVIPFKDKPLKIEQQKDRLIMSCSEDDFFNIWYEYFDLKTDYLDVSNKSRNQICKLKAPINRGKGIHILKQDQFETYVLCKLIEYVGYDKASYLMNRIAEVYGTKHINAMREAGRITWYEWPTPEMLLEKVPDDGNKLNRFLRKLSDAIVNHDYAYTHNGNELYKLLGRHELDAFPGYEIEKTIEKNFGCDIDDFVLEHLDEFEYSGLVYMYILHHIKHPPKEVKSNGIGGQY